MPASAVVNVPEVIIRVFFHKVNTAVISRYLTCSYDVKLDGKARLKESIR